MLISLRLARQALFEKISLLPPVQESLWLASGGVCAEDIHSSVHLPPWDASAMDGYAVRTEDLAAVPRPLKRVGGTSAGDAPGELLQSGECRRIFTGAPLPPGADAVVMQEDTEIDPNHPGEILFRESVRPWDHVRFRGEDITPGALIVPQGIRLHAQHLAVLAACGFESVPIHGRPRVALLANGSELRLPGQPLAPGQIRESNRVMLDALVRGVGGVPVPLEIVPDHLGQLQAALRMGLEKSDLVVTLGGASVGDADLAKTAVEGLGGTVDLWKLAIRPGKPFFIGSVEKKLVLGLPGNPVSAFVTAILLVLPALRRLQGLTDCDPPELPGELAEPMSNPRDRDHYARVIRDSNGSVRSAGPQASHRLASLAVANGLVCIPAGEQWVAGKAVRVITIQGE
jgi:molybdopterin molybdotransferase